MEIKVNFTAVILACLLMFTTTWAQTTEDSTTDSATMEATTIASTEVDLNVTTMAINDPDDLILTVGGGQAIDFDVTIETSDDSAAISGSDNWEVTVYTTDSDGGSPTSSEVTVSLSSAQMTADVSAGGSYTFSGLAATLTLTSLNCNAVTHTCAKVEPSTSATWSQMTGGDGDIISCVEVECAGSASVVINVFLAAVCLFIALKSQ